LIDLFKKKEKRSGSACFALYEKGMRCEAWGVRHNGKRPHDCTTARPQDIKTARLQDIKTARLHDRKTSRLHDCTTARHLDCTTIWH